MAWKSHEEPTLDVGALVAAELETPVSSVNPEHVAEFIHEQKETLKHVDADVKDAKRRISSFKGPKRKSKSANAAADFSGSEDGSVSA